MKTGRSCILAAMVCFAFGVVYAQSTASPKLQQSQTNSLVVEPLTLAKTAEIQQMVNLVPMMDRMARTDFASMPVRVVANCQPSDKTEYVTIRYDGTGDNLRFLDPNGNNGSPGIITAKLFAAMNGCVEATSHEIADLNAKINVAQFIANERARTKNPKLDFIIVRVGTPEDVKNMAARMTNNGEIVFNTNGGAPLPAQSGDGG